MKKLLLIAFLLFPFFAYATSGACSGHGGVSCSAGAGAYGQVICNDGWTGSSVSYSSMEECQLPPTPTVVNTCTPPVPTGCTEQFEYTQWQNLCTQQQQEAQTYCAHQSAYLGAFGGNANAPCTAPTPSTDYCAKASLCESQINTYNAAQQTYSTCIANYTQQAEQSANAQTQQEENLLQQSAAQAKQLSLDASCGANETYNQTTNQCECAAGDTYLDSECMTPDEVQEMQTVNATVAAQAEQESTPTAPRPAPTAAVPTPAKNPSVPVIPHQTSAIAKLVAEAQAQVQATTSAPAASTTPPQPSPQEPAPVHTSLLHKIYSFFANLFGF